MLRKTNLETLREKMKASLLEGKANTMEAIESLGLMVSTRRPAKPQAHCSLWNAPGFQNIAPVSNCNSHVCVVRIVVMICIILCSKKSRKWLCSKVMHQTVFQSDPATLFR